MVPGPDGRARHAAADRVALLPRPGTADPPPAPRGHAADAHGRSTVIPEGVHPAPLRRPGLPSTSGSRRTPAASARAVAGLRSNSSRRPPGAAAEVTVGRLHPMKGIDRVARHGRRARAARRTNLLIVGGDVDAPSPDELDVLATIEEVLGDAARRRPGRRAARPSPTRRSPGPGSRRDGSGLPRPAASTSRPPARRSSGWPSSRPWAPGSRSSRRPAAGRRPTWTTASPASRRHHLGRPGRRHAAHGALPLVDRPGRADAAAAPCGAA